MTLEELILQEAEAHMEKAEELSAEVERTQDIWLKVIGMRIANVHSSAAGRLLTALMNAEDVSHGKH